MSVYFLSEKSEVMPADYTSSYAKLGSVLPSLSYHIEGRPMRVNLTCTRLADAQELRKTYTSRDDLDIRVIVSENLFSKLVNLYPRDVKILSKWDVFQKAVEEYQVLFARGCMRVLFNAVDDKTSKGYRDAVLLLKQSFPAHHEVTVNDIAKYFYVQDAVFPRQVLIAFLQKRRERWALLKKCESFYPSTQVYYAMRDNLEKLIEAKGQLYKTGKRSYPTSHISANNLAMMKSVFLLPIKDPYVLMKFYEGGFTNDSC